VVLICFPDFDRFIAATVTDVELAGVASRPKLSGTVVECLDGRKERDDVRFGLAELLLSLERRIPATVVAMIDVKRESASGIERCCENFQTVISHEIEVSVEVMSLAFHGTCAQSPNDEDHRPPLETDTGSESSVRKTRSIETATLVGGSCASFCSPFSSSW
jgi:hypothetical protein